MLTVIHRPLVFSQKRLSPLPQGQPSEQLEFNYIDRLGPFRTFFGIKADIVTFGKALKAAALNRRMMDEYVTIIFSSDEAKTFAVVEPLHSSLFHCFLYPLIFRTEISEEPNKKGHKAKSLCGRP